MKFNAKIIPLLATKLGMSRRLALGDAATTNGNTRNTDSGTANPRKVDDDTLRRAAGAYMRVRDISAEVEQAIKRTDDPAEKQKLMSESKYAKMAAVKGEGMDLSDYNKVFALVKSDGTLRQKFLSFVEELKHAP